MIADLCSDYAIINSICWPKAKFCGAYHRMIMVDQWFHNVSCHLCKSTGRTILWLSLQITRYEEHILESLTETIVYQIQGAMLEFETFYSLYLLQIYNCHLSRSSHLPPKIIWKYFVFILMANINHFRG